MDLIDVKKQRVKSNKHRIEIVHCPQRNVRHISAFSPVKCTVFSASENKLRYEVGVQYWCTFFCSVENLTHLVQSC